MAIYKLKELYVSKPKYGIGAAAKKYGKYKYVRQTDIKNSEFNTFVDFGPLLNYNDILISRAGANSGESYIHKKNGYYVFAGFLVRYSLDKNIILQDYFYYWTKSYSYKKQIKNIVNSGSTMPKLNPPVFGTLNIDIPNLNEQRKIIEIIKPVEKLFLKYSKVVRIDTLENCQKDIKDLIEIIKPIEELILFCNTLKTKLVNLYIHNPLQNKFIRDFTSDINSGYSYKKGDKAENGKLKIFTIKNITSTNSFDKTNLVRNNNMKIGDVITGLSGTLATSGIIIDSNWVANQRTLSFSSKYPFQISSTIELNKDYIYKHSTGAVQKNITKDLILGIPFSPVFDNSYDKILLKLKLTEQKANQLRNCFIKLLIK